MLGSLLQVFPISGRKPEIETFSSRCFFFVDSLSAFAFQPATGNTISIRLIVKSSLLLRSSITIQQFDLKSNLNLILWNSVYFEPRSTNKNRIWLTKEFGQKGHWNWNTTAGWGFLYTNFHGDFIWFTNGSSSTCHHSPHEDNSNDEFFPQDSGSHPKSTANGRRGPPNKSLFARELSKDTHSIHMCCYSWILWTSRLEVLLPADAFDVEGR